MTVLCRFEVYCVVAQRIACACARLKMVKLGALTGLDDNDDSVQP